jgi:hypothetical protein
VLAVVQDQEHALRSQVIAQGIQDRASGFLVHAQRRDYRLRNQVRIEHRSQFDQPCPRGKGIEHLGGQPQGEARLARPARTGQREKPVRGQERPQVGQLPLASDEARELRGQIVGLCALRSQRRKIDRQVGCDQLEQALGVGEVFEPMLAEIA